MMPVEPAENALCGAIESILLVAGEPVSVAVLAGVTEESRQDVRDALHLLSARLSGGVRLQWQDDMVQFVTAPEYNRFVQRFLGTVKPAPLSRSTLEALTVIAYQQPVTRAEIESARGVNSDRAVQTLLARGLIDERGRRATLGRPAEYGTTTQFLEYFGLQSLGELPPLPDLAEVRADPSLLGLRGEQK